MSSSFRKTVEKLNESSDVTAPRMPCRWCNEPTLVSALNAYGARCFRCYEEYCAKGISGMAQGFCHGRQDTLAQAEMRKRARKILDMARDGQKVQPEEIRGALRVTGDLVGLAPPIERRSQPRTSHA
jgi:hypothetical protein